MRMCRFESVYVHVCVHACECTSMHTCDQIASISIISMSTANGYSTAFSINQFLRGW